MPEATDIHDSDLERGVSALMDAAPPGSAPSTTVAEQDAPTAPPELDASVGAMVDEARDNAAAPAAPGTPPIEALDAQLAEAADDLIAGEFADEEEILAAPTPSPAPAPVGESSAEAPPQTPANPAPAAPAPVPPAAPRPESRPAPIPKPPSPKAVPPLEPSVQSAPPARARSAAFTLAVSAIASPLVAVLAAIGAAMSAPLKNRPQYVRDTIGWFALFTLFMAACVWVFILFVRSPVAHDPVPLGHGDKAAAPVKNTKDAGHAEASPSKKAAKNDKKKPSKSEQASAAGH